MSADAADDLTELRHHQTIARSLAQPFRRIVGHQLHPGEFRLDSAIAKAHRAGFQLHRQFARPVAVFGRGGLRQERRKVAFAPDNLLNAKHRRAVPVAIEGLGGFRHYVANAQYVEIEEIVFVPDLEILVADVAAADDRHGAVDDVRLVMHPAVHAHKVKGVAGQLRRAHRRRIEQADLDVFLGVQRR